MGKKILSIFIVTFWISISEFVRNQFLLKSYWTSHCENMGLVFPSAPINGAMWGVWSLLLAIAIFFLSQKFSLIHTTLLTWLFAFVMMWVVIGNLGVLPFGILPIAVPLSLLEAFVASFIIHKMKR